jgi:hypothetical protein
MSDDIIKKQSIVFDNNNQAVVVIPSAKQNAGDISAALELPPYKAVILVLGGADNIDEKITPKLSQLFGRGIARAAIEAGALIIDGGTQAGVMAMIGEGVAGRGYKTPLIGLAPFNKVSYPGGGVNAQTPLERNHSHFVLVEGNDWGSETATMFNLTNALTTKKENDINAKASSNIPVVAILGGGGTVTKMEVLNAVRKNISLIVIEGSGGFADEVAAAWHKKDNSPDDPVMAEIIADGEIYTYQLSNSVKSIERLIIRELGTDEVLMQAWETFSDYDYNAGRQQNKFNKLQKAILIVGIVGTTLVIVQQVAAPRNADTQNLKTAAELWKENYISWWLLYYILILIPIILTVLITAANRFKQGSKWLLLRAAAESIKREIYRYRVRAMYYSNTPEQQLAQRVEDITRRAMRTEVNSSALKPYNKEKGFPPNMYASQGGDDGLSILTPDRYIQLRLVDQLNYFHRSSVKLERQLRLLYLGTFIIGGIGTFLAAIGQQVWIALTTSIAGAFGTYLGYRQTESTLTKYNQAATDLSNVKAWWNALSAEEQSNQQNIDSLVEHTEKVLQSELDGWIQQMQNSLAELRKEQEARGEKEENKEPSEPNKSPSEQNRNNTQAQDNGVDKTNKPITVNEVSEVEKNESTDVMNKQVTEEDNKVKLNEENKKDDVEATELSSNLKGDN